MKIIISWPEGRYERKTETEIPTGKTWPEMVEYIRQVMMSAYRYNTDVPVPEGLVREDDKTNSVL